MEENNLYKYPPIELLNNNDGNNQNELIMENAVKLQNSLYSFNVNATVENVNIGSTIITYEIKLAEGVRISKIKNLKSDLELILGAEIIDIKIIPEKQLLGIEVERKDKKNIGIREIIQSEEFKTSTSKLTVALGIKNDNKVQVIDLEHLTNLLVSGTTGSGKSVFLHSLINSILYKAKPNEVKFVLVDTKIVELSLYNGIPHLLLPVITNSRKAISMLDFLKMEVDNRYRLFVKYGVKDIKSYNERKDCNKKLPSIVCIIDEYADLVMLDKKETENSIYYLTQKATKVGIHIILSIERPSINIINGTIKANFPNRVVFKLPSQIDSRTVLDTSGAEDLFGNGDMLFKSRDFMEPLRYQGAFISVDEIEKIVDFIRMQG